MGEFIVVGMIYDNSMTS